MVNVSYTRVCKVFIVTTMKMGEPRKVSQTSVRKVLVPTTVQLDEVREVS